MNSHGMSDPSPKTEGQSTPFREPSCESPGSGISASPLAPSQHRPGDKESSQPLWHFIVYKTMAPVGRNTIIMLTAADTETKKCLPLKESKITDGENALQGT